jgi:L-alanine-DL-glutamate epimerase-like enolase superfamily enzyme
VKLDKTGGYREALKTIHAAKQRGLQIWIGVMVSSQLSTATHLQILPLASVGGDLDGSLLIHEDSDRWVREGFAMNRNDSMFGFLCPDPHLPGHSGKQKNVD